MTRKRMLIIIAVMAAIVLTTATLIGPGELNAKIFWKLRLPRVCTAFLAGTALAVCGMALQAMFRNPLASPFTLGISSGAALGAVVYILLGLQTAAIGIWGAPVFSFAGAVVSILLVYGLTRVRKGFSTATMLLAGVAVNFFFSSVILFLQYMSDYTQSYRFIHWTMGHLGTVGYKTV
ncbi:MAG: iron chelate uptake ABC transporter family permease subunit, partial [Planctomycetes bacterium]|nr:iron chelate uptake ABC transporter family permease subunit [Planctomycetota bacterium]